MTAYAIGIAIHVGKEICILIIIKMCCYSVTMMITKFVQVEFNRDSQEEFIDNKFADFGGNLVIAF